jgi:hypothetical protein
MGEEDNSKGLPFENLPYCLWCVQGHNALRINMGVGVCPSRDRCATPEKGVAHLLNIRQGDWLCASSRTAAPCLFRVFFQSEISDLSPSNEIFIQKGSPKGIHSDIRIDVE